MQKRISKLNIPAALRENVMIGFCYNSIIQGLEGLQFIMPWGYISSAMAPPQVLLKMQIELKLSLDLTIEKEDKQKDCWD